MADQSSTPGFSDELIYGGLTTAVIGTSLYLTMTDSTDDTLLIWSYNGSLGSDER